jgi:hypothetical protein
VGSLTETLGLEASYWKAWLATAAEVLPALSVQLPVTVALVVSGPEYVLEVHDEMPENDVPSTVALTGLTYQPLWAESGRLTDVTLGELPSYWKVSLVALAVLPALSVQLPVTVAVVESAPE